MNVRRICLNAILLALAVVLSYLESLIPSFLPGFKLGLANIVILFVIYKMSYLEAFIIDLGRIFLASLLRGTIFQMGFFMSLAGGLLSLLVMIILHRLLKDKLHIVTISVTGAVFHCVAQIIVGILYLGTSNIFYYLPFLLLTSIATGILNGFIAKALLKVPLHLSQID